MMLRLGRNTEFRNASRKRNDNISDRGQGLREKKQLNSAKSYLMFDSCGRTDEGLNRRNTEKLSLDLPAEDKSRLSLGRNKEYCEVLQTSKTTILLIGDKDLA